MRNDITRTTLAVLFIGVLIIASLWILRPFLAPVIWATMVVVATWPLMLKVERALWGRRSLAVAVMTLAMLLVFVLPFWAAIGAIVDYSDRLADWGRNLKDFKIPPPPAIVEVIPLFGAKMAASWRDVAAMAPEEIAAKLGPYVGIIVKWIAAEAGTVGMLLMQFLLVVVIAAVMYSSGETAARGVRRFARRLAGQRGDDVAVLAAQAIRGVALGVVVTALVQSTLGGLGLLVAGVPFAGLLTAVMLMFCLAQVGPTLVLVPAVAWLYWSGDNVWGTVLLVWTLFVGTLDNFLRPYLIKMGADLPLLLIFAGVIGGLVSLGLVGIFVGPVVLAVAYTLVNAWVDDVPDGAPAEGARGRADKAASP
jgi:predicted PurR-regulated permease PerM